MESAWMIFIHLLQCIKKLTHLLHSLVCFFIYHNSWKKIFHEHFPWNDLYLFFESKRNIQTNKPKVTQKKWIQMEMNNKKLDGYWW